MFLMYAYAHPKWQPYFSSWVSLYAFGYIVHVNASMLHELYEMSITCTQNSELGFKQIAI